MMTAWQKQQELNEWACEAEQKKLRYQMDQLMSELNTQKSSKNQPTNLMDCFSHIFDDSVLKHKLESNAGNVFDDETLEQIANDDKWIEKLEKKHIKNETNKNSV
jgi:hypothetical protein